MGLRRHLLILVSLIALCGSVQVWMLSRAVVPAQDAVRNVAVAQLIERDGLRSTWQDETGRPAFPLLVETTHALLRPWLRGARDGWARSAQIAAAVPLVMTVVPLYVLLVRLLDAKSAAGGTLLFCVMTETARLGADGIADSTHLLFFTLALLAGVAFLDRVTKFSADHRRGVKRPDTLAAVYIIVAGGACAVALLAKTEAIILIAVLAASIALFQVSAAWRQPWPRAALWLGCFVLALAAVLAPYVLLAGADDASESLAMLRGRNDPATWAIVNPPQSFENAGVAIRRRGRVIETLQSWRLSNGKRLSFAAKEPTISSRFHGYRAATSEFASEMGLALHYFIAPLVLLGVIRSRPKAFRAAHALVIMFCVTYAVVAVHHAATVGYLSTRHMLPLVVLGIGWAGRGAMELGPTFVKAARRIRSARPSRDVLRPAAGWAIVGLAAAACLPRTLAPLHSSRAAHRQAADWLAEQPATGDRVLDVRGWTGLYSGRTTYRYHAARLAFSDPRLRYVVVQRRELALDSRRSRTLRRLLDESATEATAFSHPDGRTEKDVLVYRWDAKRFARRLGASVLTN